MKSRGLQQSTVAKQGIIGLIQTNNEDKEYLKRTGREDKYNVTDAEDNIKKEKGKEEKDMLVLL